jgi:tetraprenyl-beta-curcumene synthase
MADRRLAWALAAVIARYLTTVQPHARRELARWRQRAHAIPDPQLRAHVLRPFDADRSAEGAALFAVLAPRRAQGQLVPLLVAYVLLWSYVDVRTERDPDCDPQLLQALLDVLRPRGSPGYARGLDDGGYLAGLLRACHAGCAALPAWDAVSRAALRLAHEGQEVQAINHGPREHAEARLRAWAGEHTDDGLARLHERCAAASSPLAIHALMALAATSGATGAETDATASAYRTVSALGVLCDHLIDQSEDGALANHSYLHCYDSAADQARGLRDLADVAHQQVRCLPAGERHAVILAAMVAMFLADEKAWTGEQAATAHAVLEALGQPTRLLHAFLSHSPRHSLPNLLRRTTSS